MAFSSRTNSTHGRRSGKTSSSDLMNNPDNWETQEKPKRDWKKYALVFGLASLSWVATYIGMLELIQANMGDLPLVQKMVVGFAVAMLMLMIVWLLDQLFAAHNLFTKMSYVAGYLFLTLISVGFGFGFYWKVLESRSEATRSAESAITQVQAGLHGASTRVSQLQTTLDGLMVISAKKAIEERTKGTSCPNSSPGDGPRRKLRDDDAARFGFASQFIKARANSINSNIKALNVDLRQVVDAAKNTFDAKTGNRNEFMRGLNRKLNLTVTGFNAFRSDPQLKQIRSDLADRSGRSTFPNGKGGTFSCPDAQLQAALRGVVRAIDQLPDIQKPNITAVEGSEAVIEAFRRLTATLFGVMQFKLPPSPEDLRNLQQKAVQSMKTTGRQSRINLEGAGLSNRDYIPLAIAIFVDLCLLLVSMGRYHNRLDNLVPKMRRAERGPVIQILSRFNEIHKDPEIRQNFEIFRHVVFDWGGDYYVAVPMDAPYTADRHMGGGRYDRVNTNVEDLRQEAHLLANLFSSFEQEKIFSRVLVPLLSTKAIQKKLHRQGSKFAGSSSFRVYKFRDGAWSEIILGAVMGAAKRVEINKRRRKIEDDIFDADEPAFETSPPVTSDNEVLAAQQPQPEPDPDDVLNRMNDVAQHINQQHAGIQSDPDTGHLPTAPNPADNRQSGPPVKVAAIDGTAVSGFGPYGAHAAAELSSQLPTPKGAVSNTAHYQTAPNSHGNAANNNTAPMAPFSSASEEASNDHSAKVIHLPNTGTGQLNFDHAPAALSTQTIIEEVQDQTEVVTTRIAPETSNTTNTDAIMATEIAQVLFDDDSSLPHDQESDRVNVEMRERTVTYSIPVEDASLPAALLQEGPSANSLVSALETQAPLEAPAPLPNHLNHQPLDMTSTHRDPALSPAINVPIITSAPSPTSFGDNTAGKRLNNEQIVATEKSEEPLIEEATVEINTSEISRRFAHGAKKD